ncbi:hypothetical protein STEG23_020417, partial [Scotinomys teguina]
DEGLIPNTHIWLLTIAYNSSSMEYDTVFWFLQYSIVYMYHIFLIHSSVEGHLGCFQVLAITNNAAMNIVEHVSL